MEYRVRGKGLEVKECGEADADATCFRRNMEGIHPVQVITVPSHHCDVDGVSAHPVAR